MSPECRLVERWWGEPVLQFLAKGLNRDNAHEGRVNGRTQSPDRSKRERHPPSFVHSTSATSLHSLHAQYSSVKRGIKGERERQGEGNN